MKKITTVAAIALTLFSGAALAEKGSAELNQVAQPTSMIQHQSSADLNMAPSDLTALNGGGEHNAIDQPNSVQHHTDADQHIALSELHSRNS